MHPGSPAITAAWGESVDKVWAAARAAEKTAPQLAAQRRSALLAAEGHSAQLGAEGRSAQLAAEERLGRLAAGSAVLLALRPECLACLQPTTGSQNCDLVVGGVFRAGTC